MPKPSIKGEVMLAERCPDPATSKSSRMRASFIPPFTIVKHFFHTSQII